MNGILNIDKPKGITSFGVVAAIRRLTGERRVGHAGTLDPDASGVLPVCVGGGTRVVEYLAEADKAYRAEIELGVTTDSYDASGNVTCCQDSSAISREQVESALSAFRGVIEQVPPMYSAVKYQGKRLYQLARQGIEVARKSRPVRIDRLEIIGWQPPLVTVDVVCGKGTYIRSLAHDLGQALGCGASLKGLVRRRYGVFDIECAVSLPHLEESFHCCYGQRYLYSIDVVLMDWAVAIVDDDTAQKISYGQPVALEGDLEENGVAAERCRAYTLDGSFLAVLRFDGEKGYWQPHKVFSVGAPAACRCGGCASES